MRQTNQLSIAPYAVGIPALPNADHTLVRIGNVFNTEVRT